MVGWLVALPASTRRRISQTCCFTRVKHQFRSRLFGTPVFHQRQGAAKIYVPEKSRPKLTFYLGKTSCLRIPSSRRRPIGDQPANHKRRPQRKVFILLRGNRHAGVRSVSVVGWLVLFRASTGRRISQTCCFTSVKRQFRARLFLGRRFSVRDRGPPTFMVGRGCLNLNLCFRKQRMSRTD